MKRIINGRMWNEDFMNSVTSRAFDVKDPVTGEITCVKVKVKGLDKSVNLWMGTTAEYAAIKTKSPADTVYFFTNVNLYDVYTTLTNLEATVRYVMAGTILVPNAKHADKADEADEAAYSVHSSYADGAGRALKADHADTADTATNATNAENSTNDGNGKKIPYGEVLAKAIDAKTGVETKFARLAHIVRGGSPTLRDRLTATRMGAKAVDLLLEGKSNLVVIEKEDQLDSIDIVFALTLDRMYKGKLKDGDLDKFSAEDIAKMEALCQERRDKLKVLYDLAYQVSQ
jgi:6-phosphofructokinase